jgi:hypothetical protein
MVVEEPHSKSDALNAELGAEVGIKKKVFFLIKNLFFFKELSMHDVYQNPLSLVTF